MTEKMQTTNSWTLLLPIALALAACPNLLIAAEADNARAILDATGVRGGLVVHLGCGDGKLTAALRANDRFVVQGLDPDPENVQKARGHVESLGLYGKVSIDRLRGNRLPYADNLVNLVVAEDLGKVAAAEVMRVLAPNGAAYVQKGGKWTKTVKPWPEEIDEWTHYLHGASNNAVAEDARVGPPRRLQWTAGPPWCRSHEFISSFCAMVSGGGRVFYVIDEGQPGVTDGRLPERWMLIGRDAFNGVLLWKRPLPQWRADEWRGTSMRGRPPSVPRRIVAGGDRLYATLSHRGPLCILDPATGKTLEEIDGTEGTQEIALTGKTLVLRVAGVERDAKHTTASIAAVDADKGKILWRVPVGAYQLQSLAAADGAVIYADQNSTVCLNLADGKERWRSGTGPQPKKNPKENLALPGTGVAKGRTVIITISGEDDEAQVFLHDGKGNDPLVDDPKDPDVLNDQITKYVQNAVNEKGKTDRKGSKKKRRGQMTFILHDGLVLETDGSSIVARSLDNGKTLWTAKTGGGAMRGHDLFATGGCVWHAATISAATAARRPSGS